jgi:hypothetical protein
LEERLCRGGTKSRIVEDYVKLCQVGIEQVQVCTRELYFEFIQRGKCQGEDTIEFLNTLVNRQKRYFRVVEHSEGKSQQRVLRTGAKSAQDQHVLKCWRKLKEIEFMNAM